jgi:P-type conjugative transfer protein TrbJ
MKKIILIMLFCFFPRIAFGAGIPVFDGVSVTQEIIMTIESISQTMKQIQEFETQILQYENMIKNTIAAPFYIYKKTEQLMQRAQNIQSTIDYYRNRDWEAYLRSYMNPSEYAGTEYFAEQEMMSAERRAKAREALYEAELAAINQQIEANKALMQQFQDDAALRQQDAEDLRQIEAGAKSAEGQMQAIQYGNQMLGTLNNQLLQLREMIARQQKSMVEKANQDANESARRSVVEQQFRSGIASESIETFDIAKMRYRGSR